jgi:ribonuclease P protein component
VGLPKTNRLKHRRDFLAVYEQGIRRHSPHLILRALLEVSINDSLVNDPTRIGISISQKVSKKAVIRNRIKRQIRAVFRELLPYVPGGWKIVIVVKPKASECKYEHFLRELKQLLIEAEIINGY